MDYRYKKILIALDGSKMSKKAFDRAIDITKRDDAKLFLTHVVDKKHYSAMKPYINMDDLLVQSKKVSLKMLDNYEKIAKEMGVSNTKKIIEFGSPKEIILDKIIPKEKIDLVILGVTGINAAERILIGSVSENIFRYANCDVLVIK